MAAKQIIESWSHPTGSSRGNEDAKRVSSGVGVYP
jgi:hypothetical protein